MVSTQRAILLFALAASPFYLNDFLFQLADRPVAVLAVDYGFRLISLGLIWSIAPLRYHALAPLPTHTPAHVVFGGAVVFAGIIIAASLMGRFLDVLVPDTATGSFSGYGNDPYIKMFDLTFGLFLVAVSEEMVFRRLFHNFFSTRLRHPHRSAWLSALLFGAIHWSGGLGSCFSAFLAGLLLMNLMRRTGRLWPCILAHYLVNLWFYFSVS